MTASTRIKGKALKLELGSPGTDYWADITAAVLDSEEADGDVTTFKDASEGGARQFFFTLTALQSTSAESFWRKVWEAAGTEVPYTYAPHGNAVATPEQPHFTGMLTIGPKPTIGGEAGRTNTYTFETRFDVIGTPVLDDGTP